MERHVPGCWPPAGMAETLERDVHSPRNAMLATGRGLIE